jgi:hypothetical protein
MAAGVDAWSQSSKRLHPLFHCNVRQGLMFFVIFHKRNQPFSTQKQYEKK